MEKATSFLKDWAKEFIKNKNLVTKTLAGVEDDGKDIVAKHKDGRVHRYIIVPFLNSFVEALTELGKSPDMHLSVVAFNTDAGFKALLDNWKELSKHKNFSVLYVNPFSQIDKRWIINPHVHSRVCDEESLELGLKAMYETVEPTNESEIKSRI